MGYSAFYGLIAATGYAVYIMYIIYKLNYNLKSNIFSCVSCETILQDIEFHINNV